MEIAGVPEAVWRDMVDRLAAHGVRYLVGGSGWDGNVSPYRRVEDAPLRALLYDLTQISDARLRHSLIALLLRHPEYAAAMEDVANHLLPEEPSWTWARLSLAIAAALQAEWSFSLDLYLGGGPEMDAEAVACDLGLPSPREDFGRPCLVAAARLLRSGAPFPYSYKEDWENVVHRLLAQLALEQNHNGS